MSAPTGRMHQAAAQYTAAGYTLSAWPRESGKGPRGTGWGLLPFPPSDVTEAHNFGLNHALSRTAVLDVDDVPRTREVLEFLGIELDDLVQATMSWRGNPERIKLAFRAPTPMLQVKKLNVWLRETDADQHTVFELRGAADGKQAQDVLPPSIHPGTQLPYHFETSFRPRDDLPDMPAALLEIWRNWDAHSATLRRLLGDAKLPVKAAKPFARSVPQQPPGGSVIDAFNASHTAAEILARNGYVPKGKRWLRPNSTTGVAGIVQFPDGSIYSHSGGLLGDQKPHDAFDLFQILECEADNSRAVREAAKLLGMNKPRLNGHAVQIPQDMPDDDRFAPIEGEIVPPPMARIPSGSLCLNDFHSYMPMHTYIYEPTGEMWPSSSVNSRLLNPENIKAPASLWLDQNRAVEQMTWAPGEPIVITERLVSNGGWMDRPGARCFNLYKPPQIKLGDATLAGPWLDHVDVVYPDCAKHIIAWLAQRVQRPHEKINHALLLGGSQGIGKDTLLEPVKHAVGAWNFNEVSPSNLLGRFNGFVRSVILRVSEARDLGDVDRFAFYDHMKVYTAAPPDVLRCDEKHIREYSVFNVMGVILTTNHKTDGIYLPADDRRHYVCWSDLTKESFTEDYWNDLWKWYADGGIAHVAAYLATLDISGFNPKAPPPKTAAFFDIVDANRSPEDADLADLLDAVGNPNAITLSILIDAARANGRSEFQVWLEDRKNRRNIPHRLEAAGYSPVRNEFAKDGLWKIYGRRQAVYTKSSLAVRDRIAAATSLVEPIGQSSR